MPLLTELPEPLLIKDNFLFFYNSTDVHGKKITLKGLTCIRTLTVQAKRTGMHKKSNRSTVIMDEYTVVHFMYLQVTENQ